MSVSYDSYETIVAERRGKVLTLTLNRPEVRNAANVTMHNELSRIFHDTAKDDETAVVVLTGAGDAFSAGGDIASMREKIEDQSKWIATVEEARQIFYGMVDNPKPIIARLRGPASGLGATLVVYSDIVIADETAKIGDPHVKVGLAAGDGGALMWPMQVGFMRAKEYLFLGHHMDAKEAERIGMVNYVVPEDELDAKVYEIADRIASGATKAIGWTKLSINQTLKTLASSVMEVGLSLETLSHLTKDHEEAVDAFINKRKPVFKGH